jgi:hypothetical protein
MPSKSQSGEIVGRVRFAKISAVEGIHLTAEMKESFAKFDRRRLPADKRRREIVERHKRKSA